MSSEISVKQLVYGKVLHHECLLSVCIFLYGQELSYALVPPRCKVICESKREIRVMD